MSDLCVLARFRAKSGREKELETLLHGLIAPTRAEAGCRQYVLWQRRDDPGFFTLVERWESEGVLEEHLAMPYLRDAIARFGDLLDGDLELEKYLELA